MKKFTVISENYREPIESMSQIGRNGSEDKSEYCVYVNPDQSRTGDPYLKYYNARSYSKADKVIRLGMKKFEIIHHSDGLRFWDVTRKELKTLDNFLSGRSKIFSPYTNWQVALYLWNYESDLFTDIPDKYNTIIEAFFDGYFDTEENLNKPNYLPSFQKQILYADEIAE